MQCESKAMAELNGEYEQGNKTALILGSFFHSWSEGPEAFQKFKDNHPEIYTRKGTLRKSPNYAIIDDWINILKDDKMAMQSLEGEKEVIITGELFGIDWKIMVDSIDHKRKAFTDLKTTREINRTYWNDENKEKENFILYWNYDIQLAVYAEILKRHLKMDEHYTPHILAVDKGKPPDKELIYMPREDIEPILDRIELDIPRVYDVWKGNVEPKGCGRCEYCKSIKKLKEAVYYMDIGI